MERRARRCLGDRHVGHADGLLQERRLGAARDAGFGKFQVYLNGSEIDPADAPESLSPGDSLEIRPYEVAG